MLEAYGDNQVHPVSSNLVCVAVCHVLMVLSMVIFMDGVVVYGNIRF